MSGTTNKYKNLFNYDVNLCLFTDIDNTFWVNDRNQSPNSDFNQKYYSYLKKVHEFCDNANIPIIPVTGRDFEGMMYDMNKDHNIPQLGPFKIMALSVGTEIWIRKDGKYFLDEEYDKMLSKRFNKKTVYKLLEKLISNASPEFDLKIQPQDRIENYDNPNNQKYKLSLNCVCHSHEMARTLEENILQYLDSNLKKPIHVIFSQHSIQDDGQIKYDIDIVPVNKSFAIQYIKKKLGSEKSIFAGDSGNDWDSIRDGHEYSIIVGGAKNELLRKLKSLKLEKGNVLPDKFLTNGKNSELYIEKDEDGLGPKSILKVLKTIESKLHVKSTK